MFNSNTNRLNIPTISKILQTILFTLIHLMNLTLLTILTFTKLYHIFSIMSIPFMFFLKTKHPLFEGVYIFLGFYFNFYFYTHLLTKVFHSFIICLENLWDFYTHLLAKVFLYARIIAFFGIFLYTPSCEGVCCARTKSLLCIHFYTHLLTKVFYVHIWKRFYHFEHNRLSLSNQENEKLMLYPHHKSRTILLLLATAHYTNNTNMKHVDF